MTRLSTAVHVAVTTLLFLVTASGTPARPLDAERFHALVEAGMERWQVPGLAVSVIEDGEIVMQRTGDALQLRTGMYEYDVSHWHLDTFLVDYVAWRFPSFASFTIGPDGRIATLEVLDHVFEPE